MVKRPLTRAVLLLAVLFWTVQPGLFGGAWAPAETSDATVAEAGKMLESEVQHSPLTITHSAGLACYSPTPGALVDHTALWDAQTRVAVLSHLRGPPAS